MSVLAVLHSVDECAACVRAMGELEMENGMLIAVPNVDNDGDELQVSRGVRVYVCMDACMYACVCMHLHVRMCTYVCRYVSGCVCMCMRMREKFIRVIFGTNSENNAFQHHSSEIDTPACSKDVCACVLGWCGYPSDGRGVMSPCFVVLRVRRP